MDAKKSKFKLLHLSDFHFVGDPIENLDNAVLQFSILKRWPHTAREDIVRNFVLATGLAGSHDEDLAKKVASFVKDQEDIDLVLISGDLAATGRRDDLLEALRYTTKNLENNGVPILLMPGNHDRFRGYSAEPGGSEFDNIFSRFLASANAGVNTHVLTRGESSLAIITADFCLKAKDHADSRIPFSFAGRGKVYLEVVERMVDETQSLHSNNVGVIWVVHFPPSSEAANGNLKLDGWEMVIYAARQEGINYILSGHIHRRATFYEHGVTILCAGAACTFKELDGNWIHILDFSVAGKAVNLETRRNYKWHDGAESFQLQW